MKKRRKEEEEKKRRKGSIGRKQRGKRLEADSCIDTHTLLSLHSQRFSVCFNIVLCLSQFILSTLTTNHCDKYNMHSTTHTTMYISHLTQIGRLHDALALHACVRWTDSPPLLIRCPPSLALCGVSFCWSRSCSLAGSEGFTLRAIIPWRTRWLGGEKIESRGSSIQHSAFRSEDSVYNILRTTHTHTHLSEWTSSSTSLLTTVYVHTM